MALPSTNADHHAVARCIGRIAAAEEEKDGRTPVEIAPSRPVKPWNRRLDHEPYAGQGPRVLVPGGLFIAIVLTTVIAVLLVRPDGLVPAVRVDRS